MKQSLYRVAIVGAGPAGLYAAGHLIEQLDINVEVDIYDRLPTPFGLVRAGVAPDHPDKKLIVDNLFDVYLNHPKVRFIGNIDVGVDLSHDELSSWYDAVIYSVGASSDVQMGIEGEELAGSWAAREFVAWYNGHPDYSHLNFDLSHKRAVVVGNGNVALDVARILTLSIDELKQTDIADYAIDALSKSAIEEVVLLGRRSHYQGAFNNPELEELEHLNNVEVNIENDDLPEVQARALEEKLDWSARRKVKTLKRLKEAKIADPKKRIIFRFLSSPVALISDESSAAQSMAPSLKNNVSKLLVTKNRLEQSGSDDYKAVPSDSQSEIDAGLVLRAIGYRGKPSEGLPFDTQKGVISNKEGRVVDGNNVLAGVYVTGWIKRGPRGVIGSNKKCARDTVKHLLSDLQGALLPLGHLDSASILAKLSSRKESLVTEQDWHQIDRVECISGREQKRPRVKLTQWQQLLAAKDKVENL